MVELKKSRKESDLESDAEKAMAQIHEKGCAHGLKGRTILYGASFYSKNLFIMAEEALSHRSVIMPMKLIRRSPEPGAI